VKTEQQPWRDTVFEYSLKTGKLYIMINTTTIPQSSTAVEAEVQDSALIAHQYADLIDFWSGAWNKSYILALMSDETNVRAVQTLVARYAISETAAWNIVFENLLHIVVPD
jgi:hypothetical protein